MFPVLTHSEALECDLSGNRVFVDMTRLRRAHPRLDGPSPLTGVFIRRKHATVTEALCEDSGKDWKDIHQPGNDKGQQLPHVQECRHRHSPQPPEEAGPCHHLAFVRFSMEYDSSGLKQIAF